MNPSNADFFDYFARAVVRLKILSREESSLAKDWFYRSSRALGRRPLAGTELPDHFG
jgi:hypothetical protein